jgi:hypothetical protein
MIHNRNVYDDRELINFVIYAVGNEGGYVTPRNMNKYFAFGEYFWSKALKHLADNKGWMRNIGSPKSGYLLLDNEIDERTWGYIEGYNIKHKLTVKRFEQIKANDKKYQAEKKYYQSVKKLENQRKRSQ